MLHFGKETVPIDIHDLGFDRPTVIPFTDSTRTWAERIKPKMFSSILKRY
jgi:hypothetical protein